MSKEKSTEIRMRNTLKRRGCRLKKSARRDPLALDYGQYWIIDIETNTLIAGDEFGMSLDNVVSWVGSMEGNK